MNHRTQMMQKVKSIIKERNLYEKRKRNRKIHILKNLSAFWGTNNIFYGCSLNVPGKFNTKFHQRNPLKKIKFYYVV